MKIKSLALILLCTTVANAQCWSTVAAGYSFTIVKTPQGRLYTVGANSYGQLGNGTSGFSTGSTVFQPVGTDTDWGSFAAGDFHALAVRTNGTLWVWGSNSQGELGDGTNIFKSSPIQIGTDTNWASVTAGYDFSLAIKTDGTLWGWGENLYGELGLGTHGPSGDTNFPQQVGTDTNWKMVSAGSQHTTGRFGYGVAMKSVNSVSATTRSPNMCLHNWAVRPTGIPPLQASIVLPQ